MSITLLFTIIAFISASGFSNKTSNSDLQVAQLNASSLLRPINPSININHLLLLSDCILLILLIGGVFYVRRLTQKRNLHLNLIKEHFRKSLESVNKNEAIQDMAGDISKLKIETTLGIKLNETDWKILNTLYKNPAIGNQELANEVLLSVGGIRSSLTKLYKQFDVKMARNQRLALVLKAIRVSRI